MIKIATTTVSRKNYLAWIGIGIFYFFYLTTAWSNRLVPGDDLYFLNALNEKGLIESIIDFNYNKRFASLLFFNLTFYFTPNLETTSISLFVYQVILLIGLVTSSYFLVKEITHRFIDSLISRSQLFLISNIISIGIFFSVPQFIETWFWMIGSAVYGIPIIASLFGFYFLLQEKNTLLSYFGLFLSFLIVGGCLETLALSNMAIIISISIIPRLLIGKKTIIVSNGKIIVAILACCLLLSLNLIAGGMSARISLENNAIIKHSTTWMDFFQSFFLSKNTIPLFVLIIVFLSSCGLKKAMPIDKNYIKNLLNLNLLLLIIVSIITLIPLFLVFNNIGNERAWLPIHFFTFISLVFWSYFIGRRLTPSYLTKKINTAFLLFTGLLAFYTFRQVPRGYSYSIAYDKMINSILMEKEKNRQSVMELPTLPEPGFLVQFDISKEPNSWNNETVKRVMHLPFDIKKED